MLSENAHTVLITGYSGLIAKHLSNHLTREGFIVKGLTQNKAQLSQSVFYWNVSEKIIDEHALENVDYVIHLAGSGIADKRWTIERKKEIIESRVQSTLFLAQSFRKANLKIKALIGTSAIGYYGAISSEKIFTENDAAGNDFISDCCVQWEKSYQAFNYLTDRTVILRLPTVLSETGGALHKILPFVKFGLASPIGSGKQFMPLICIEDLVKLYEFAITSHDLYGTFNANAPLSVTNKDFMSGLAKALNKSFFLPNTPSIILKLLYGELACVLLYGSRVNSSKIITAGFSFSYPTLDGMLRRILQTKN